MAPHQTIPPGEFISGSIVRRKLLKHLWEGPKTPTELASLESKHVSHVSRALKELSALGVVEQMHGESRERYYRMTERGYLIFANIARMQ
jgi:predicted transcriptional regulator